MCQAFCAKTQSSVAGINIFCSGGIVRIGLGTGRQRAERWSRPARLLVSLSAACGCGEEILHYPEISVQTVPLLEGNTPPIGMNT